MDPYVYVSEVSPQSANEAALRDLVAYMIRQRFQMELPPTGPADLRKFAKTAAWDLTAAILGPQNPPRVPSGSNNLGRYMEARWSQAWSHIQEREGEHHSAEVPTEDQLANSMAMQLSGIGNDPALSVEINMVFNVAPLHIQDSQVGAYLFLALSLHCNWKLIQQTMLTVYKITLRTEREKKKVVDGWMALRSKLPPAKVIDSLQSVLLA